MTFCGETCARCQGNGEIIVDWSLYLHGNDDENAVAECPDCDGTGLRLRVLDVIEGRLGEARCMACKETATELDKVREALSELVDLMQGVIDGEYKPDSFTLQPARAALINGKMTAPQPVKSDNPS